MFVLVQLTLSLQSLETLVCEKMQRLIPVCEKLESIFQETQRRERERHEDEVRDLRRLILSLKETNPFESGTSYDERATSPLRKRPLSPNFKSQSEAVLDPECSRPRQSSDRRFHSGSGNLGTGFQVDAELQGTQGQASEIGGRGDIQSRQSSKLSELQATSPFARELTPVDDPLRPTSEALRPIADTIPDSQPALKGDAAEKEYAGKLPAKKVSTQKRSAKKAPAKSATIKYGRGSRHTRRFAAAQELSEGDNDGEGGGIDRETNEEQEAGSSATVLRKVTRAVSRKRQLGHGCDEPVSDGANRSSSPAAQTAVQRGKKRRTSADAPRRGKDVDGDAHHVANGPAPNSVQNASMGGHRYPTRARGKAPKVPEVWF